MKNFKEKNKTKKMLQSWPAIVILGVIIIVFARNLTIFIKKADDTIQNRKLVENKINELNESKAKLTTDIEALQTDRGVEENIRQNFGLAKEGEEVISIVEDTNKEVVEPKKPGFWARIQNWFR